MCNALLLEYKKNQRCRPFSITSSVEPPMILDDGYFERPAMIALVESTLYDLSSSSPPSHDDDYHASSSWTEPWGNLFPRRGLHLMSLNIFNNSVVVGEGNNKLKEFEMELAKDLSNLPPGVLLVARGGIPCLVAQYYLESMAVAGLVLVDPVILPDTEEEESSDATRLQSSASIMIEIQRAITTGNKSAANVEMKMLKLFASGGGGDRRLRLEPGAVLMLVINTFGSSGSSGVVNEYEDWYQHCANVTADYHSTDDQLVPVISLSEDHNKDDCSGDDGLPHQVMEEVYAWYDEYVA